MTTLRIFKAFKESTFQEPLKLMLLGSLLMLGSTAAAAQNSAPGFDAAQAEKERVRRESTGLLGGMVVGGLVGGPPGAILSAAAGALLGNHVSAGKEREQLLASLEANRRELLALREENRTLENRYRLAAETARENRLLPAGFSPNITMRPVPCCEDTALSLHFRTDSSEIEAHYLAQLEEFAHLVRQVPEAVVQVIGYADRRGHANRNLELSRLRVQAVERALRSLGIGEAAIRTVAVGENRPVAEQENLEGHFYDRRVDLQVSTQNNGYLTGLAD